MKRPEAIAGRAALRLGMMGCLVGILLCWAHAQARAKMHDGTKMDWGGHLRAIGSMSFVDDDSIYRYASAVGVYSGPLPSAGSDDGEEIPIEEVSE